MSAAGKTADNAADKIAEKINSLIANELGVKAWQVAAAVGLLDGGSTVPFIARYRKEVTGTLDDAQLRDLEERLRYLRELEDRRTAVLAAIEEQGALTDQLREAVVQAATKAELEDLYLPYKSKRRTKAQIAREAGLEPLADALIADPSRVPDEAASAFVSDEKGVASAADALAGARAILTERVGQDTELVHELRERLWRRGRVCAQAAEGTNPELAGKYADYADYVQPLESLAGHRVLALLRGEREGALTVALAEADPRDEAGLDEARAGYENAVSRSLGIRGGAATPGGKWLAQTVRIAWRGRLQPRLESDLRSRLFEAAEEEAVRVFAANLRDVLLAAPAGNRAVLGLDPGLRTGVKVAVVDQTGKVVDTATIYPHAPVNKWKESLATLEALALKHSIELVAVGNGTASRETDRLAGELLARLAQRAAPARLQNHGGQNDGGPNDGGQNEDAALKPAKVIVSEAGASVYSASALASAELPDLDVSLRGAVSIARRLQDPLAELVKIEPKSIGVGQYQHDLTPAKLERSLAAVVEDCVNAVGVDVNTASPSLLARVAGVGTLLSRSIVEYRDANGPFASRTELKKVPRLGAKAFEQCAGFLRITGGPEPLDASAVHPEAYGLAHRILAAAGVRAGSGRAATRDAVTASTVATLDPAQFADERFGLPTVKDVMAELVRPGRDPRPEFVTAVLKEGVESIADLKPGMVLEGTVSNVAAFGAFVDIGVHQDGLVHVSAMSSKFVSDPREIVKSGQVVRVKVLDVDVPRKRISLSLRLDDEIARPGESRRGGEDRNREDRNREDRNPVGSRNGEQRRGGDDRRRPQKGDGGRGADRGRGGDSPRGRAPQGAPDTALAEALRRAGLTK